MPFPNESLERPAVVLLVTATAFVDKGVWDDVAADEIKAIEAASDGLADFVFL